MASLINKERPPVFCPGCAHERAVYALDKAFTAMGLTGEKIAMVSDIGCSGLFDTFFNTHAMHGLHGRALTYAAGIKLARPHLQVVATMGDGGLGIGGQHLLSACRRNLDITLLVLNNFNFGMTGGQFSATTPAEAVVGSGFLNRLEKPFEAGRVCAAAGAGYVAAASAYDSLLPDRIREAIEYKGFSILEIQGVCPGRYTKKNKLTPGMIEESLRSKGYENGPVPDNQRSEYGQAYRLEASARKPADRPLAVEAVFSPPFEGLCTVSILGSAGQRIITAGELLGLAGMTAGLQVTQKNEYNITVLRGPSIADLILSPGPVGYTGTETPNVVLALADEGVQKRKDVFGRLAPDALAIRAADVSIPETRARVVEIDFKAQKIKEVDRALTGLAALAGMNEVLTLDMLLGALRLRFRGGQLETAEKQVREASGFVQ